jgi:zinc protease
MSEVLLYPSFPADELDKIKRQTISALEAGKDEPSTISSNVAKVLNYGKSHPYGEVTTAETVERVTVADCKAYHKQHILPNNAYLAIVGDITLAEAKKLANTHFRKWKKGKVTKRSFPQPQTPAGEVVSIVDRPQSVQSLIRITYPVELKPYADEEVKVDVMNEILGGGFSARLMQNLREKYGYTYGVGSRVFSDKHTGRFTTNASVRNEVTDSALVQFLYELNRIREELVTEEELAAAKASVSGEFARSLEQPQTIAGFAISTAKYNLSPDYFKNYLTSVEAVTREDVLAVARKYITPANANIVIVGKAAEIAPALEQFGEIKYYDMNGNEVQPVDRSAPADLTAESVISRFLESIGGEEKLNAIADIAITMEGDVSGQKIGGRHLFSAPNKYVVEMSMSGMALSKSVSNGTKMQTTQMGMAMPASEENLMESLVNNHPFPELIYSEAGVELTLVGSDEIDGMPVYIVEVAKPDGSKSFHAFDAETGLKVREEQTIESPMGAMAITSELKDYTDVGDGVMMPAVTRQKVGPQVITMTVKEVLVNKGIDDGAFEVK